MSGTTLPPAPAGTVAPTGDERRPPRVLVVEDDPDAREAVVLTLQAAGMEVIEEARAEGALSAVHRERPDVLVVDVGLPGADGLALLDALRAVRSLAGTPTIVMTGLDPFEVGRRAARLDVRVFLQKPVPRRELLAAVATCLSA
jgi:DNA-binding response OmpR family regulator